MVFGELRSNTEWVCVCTTMQEELNKVRLLSTLRSQNPLHCCLSNNSPGSIALFLWLPRKCLRTIFRLLAINSPYLPAYHNQDPETTGFQRYPLHRIIDGVILHPLAQFPCSLGWSLVGHRKGCTRDRGPSCAPQHFRPELSTAQTLCVVGRVISSPRRSLSGGQGSPNSASRVHLRRPRADAKAPEPCFDTTRSEDAGADCTTVYLLANRAAARAVDGARRGWEWKGTRA